MRILLPCLLFICFSFSALANTPSPEGLWLTQNKRSVIKIERCDLGLCGKIHWIIEGGMQYDAKNPDESRRNAPMCGLQILWGFDKKSDSKWTGGRIYKADDGDVYKSNLSMQGYDALKVRGYVGLSLFGKTQLWQRVQADSYPPCKP